MKFRIVLIGFLLIVMFNYMNAQENIAQSRLLARRAAIADAQRILVKMIDGIYIDSKTMVREFITRNDTVRAGVEGFIRGAEVVSESFENSIAKVTLRIDIKQLKKILNRDFSYELPFLEAIGRGTTGSTEYVSSVENTYGSWFDNAVQAKGYGIAPDDPTMSQSQKDLMAERAAKLDAYRNLIEQIQMVHIDAQTTVKDCITRDDTILSNLHAFVRGARVIGSLKLPDGRWEVTLEIMLEPVRSFIH